MTVKTVENNTNIPESTQSDAILPISEGGWQVLDGRPVGIYRGPDNFTTVACEQVIEFVGKAVDGYKRWQKCQEQVSRLGGKVADWVTSQKSKVAGFIGAWRIPESNGTSRTPMVKAVFVIAQTTPDEIDETLWLEIARLDVQVAESPEFSDIRASFIPVPFMTQDQMAAYLWSKCKQ